MIQLADCATDAIQRVLRALKRQPYFAGQDALCQILEQDGLRSVQMMRARVNHE